jgi:hypothetical protein
VVTIRFVYIIASLVLLSYLVAASEVDLIDYPDFFMDKYSEDIVFVIGDYADVADAIGSVDVATSLQAASGKAELVGVAKLASEIETDDVENYNIISIGGPCANPITSKLMGHPRNCNEGFVPGRALIKLFSNGDNIGLVIAGATAIDTQRACRVLARYDNYNLVGREVNVEGTNLQDMILTQR